MTFVFLEGIYQDKSTYSISGSTLTFATAPQSGYNIEVMVLGAISASTNALYTDTFTGDGSTTDYALGITPVDLNAIEVYLNGLYQNVSTLTLTGNTVTFATAPPTGVIIEIRSVGFLNSGGTLAPATLIGGVGINVTTNSPNNFTIANTLGGGIDWDTNIKAATFSANPGRGYIVNTTSGEVTINLPAGVPGNIVAVQDYAGTFDTNNLIISANGTEKIQARSTDAKSVTENASIYLLYQDATRGWTADNIIDNPPTFNVDYLVIAGGGAGGRATAGGIGAAGGGAGGLRTSFGSTSGGGASAETALALLVATNYTVTIGAGGSGPTSGNTSGPNGSNSVFSTITSIGGGGGATNNTGGGFPAGGNGGSGGGTYQGAIGAGTANQGFNGGLSSSGSSGGGGGGAGGVGANSNYSTPTLGNGGLGLQNSITGSLVTYAGGGGGGQYGSEAGGPGAGGSSIGGAGGSGGGNAGGNGNTSTGSGGGGGGDGGNGGNGGSGVVILRYPSTYTISGLSGTTATVGSDKVTTFTSGTGNIQFN
jgi:hypothetical protein